MMQFIFLIMAICMSPFMLDAAMNDLPYDYIDNDIIINRNIAKRNHTTIKQLKSATNKEPRGFIIGIGGIVVKPYIGRTIGGNFDGVDGNIIRLYYEQKPTKIDGGLNILAGYKWFFGIGTFGIRLYADYTARFLNIFTEYSNTTTSLVSHNIAANFDVLFNITKTQPFKFGIILGGGVGGVFEKLDPKSHLGESNIINPTVNANIGFRFVIFNSSAIELLGQSRFTIP